MCRSNAQKNSKIAFKVTKLNDKIYSNICQSGESYPTPNSQTRQPENSRPATRIIFEKHTLGPPG